jgi:hypothetical protein
VVLLVVVTFFCSFLHAHMPAPRLFCSFSFLFFSLLVFLDPLDQNLERGGNVMVQHHSCA